ncbi:MAG: hypothetical protein IJ157_10265 [Clostridia bacterium]|nr:hypothetical protein [Clostridia bacterium]
MQKKTRRSLITLLLCALALAFTAFVFAPIEQYMLNQSEMWFNLGDIAPLSLLCFALLAALLTGIGMLLPAKARRAYTAVLLGLTVCLYLQGNFINPDYGELDGRAVRWEDYKVYAVIDTLFWIAVPVGLAAFAIKKGKLFRTAARGVAAALIVIQAVTLAAVLLTHPIENKRGSWIVSDKDQFMLGSEANTVMFVVDACDTTYIPRIQAEDPDALEPLDGFTYYSDYSGAYSKTKMGLPFTLTMHWYENDETIEDYIERCYDGVPLYAALSGAGWDIRLYTAETYMSSHMIGQAENVISSQLTVGSYPKLFGKMMEFVGFRYAPHLLKPQFVFYSGEFGFYKAAEGDDQPYFKDNFIFQGKLSAESLRLGDGKQFIVYHINGSHLPCNMDENGLNVGNWNTTATEQTKGVLRTIIGPYLEQMKALGVYDSANIIITADHGRFDEGPSSPVMLLKPAFAHGEIQENTAMTGVADLHATLMKLCGFETEGEAIYEIDPAAERTRRYLYYPTTRQNGGTLPPLTEYHVERGQQFVPTGEVLEGGKENIIR